MFYKDRTLLRMSLRKTLGLGPYAGCKLSLSLSTRSLSPSVLIFHLVRDKKEQHIIDSAECGRQRLRQGQKPVVIAIPSVCIEQRVNGDRLCRWEELRWGGSGAHWFWLCLGRKGERDGEKDDEGMRNREGKSPAKVKGEDFWR